MILRFIPPPVWVVILLIATYALSTAPILKDAPRFPPQFIPGIATLLAATMLISLAWLQFNRAHTQVLPLSPTNNALVTNGVFALTRNPMYLGMTLYCLGGALMMGNTIMLLAPILMFAVANWVFIPFEEAKMRRQFGEQFDAYCKRVRRWI